MNDQQIALVISEAERLWRSRTPAKHVNDGIASYRVAFSELHTFAKTNGFELDRTQPAFIKAQTKLFSRLKREFPNERWIK